MEKKTMAKECLIQKHKKQSAAWEKLNAEERAIMELPKDKREEALAAFKAKRIKMRMYKTRQYNRCSITGRASGYFRFFGVCRHVFREKAHRGELPGIVKSSW
jgi:small subunit ribosomal protein S14